MNIDLPILFFDSGLGGLTTLLIAQKVLPNENYIYVADFLNSPFGNKTKKDIKNLVTKNIKFYIKKYNPKCIVLACNTATAVCIKSLRSEVEIPIIGTEPAIKEALRLNSRKTLILCTQATKRYSQLLKSFSDNLAFFCPRKLAELIDQNFLYNMQKIKAYLNKSLKKFAHKFDACVLGCTHYSLVKTEIENILGFMVVDGNFGVAKQVEKVIKEKNKIGKTLLISTDLNRQNLLYKSYKKLKGEKLCAE